MMRVNDLLTLHVSLVAYFVPAVVTS
jgi:hypothetical protein